VGADAALQAALDLARHLRDADRDGEASPQLRHG
jgi:hypothetical protein